MASGIHSKLHAKLNPTNKLNGIKEKTLIVISYHVYSIAEATNWVIDGTFNAAPKLFCQMVTIISTLC